MTDPNVATARPIDALPVTLTFYDCIREAYSTTIYVRKDTPHAEVEPLVQAIADLSVCVLGRYRIGRTVYVPETAKEAMKSIPNHVMGTMKWLISYKAVRPHDQHIFSGSFTIPGRSVETAADRSRLPDVKHPKWEHLFELLRKLSVSRHGYEPHPSWFTASYQSGNWPPKRAKKRLKAIHKKERQTA